jgi:hypothetical protein
MDPQRWPREPQDEMSLSTSRGREEVFTIDCTYRAFTGVNSKSAWRAPRLQESSYTGVHSKTRYWNTMVLTMHYTNQRSGGNQW